MTLFQIGLIASLLVAVAHIVWSRICAAEDQEANFPSWGAVVASVFIAITVRFFFVLLLLRTEFVAFESDEITRWMISNSWSQTPYFFTSWDGIWLSGNFAYYGFFMWFFQSPLVALQVGNCVAQAVGIAGLAYTGYVIGGSRRAAMASALLASVGYPFMIMGTGALSEVVMMSLIAPLFAFTCQFLSCSRNQVMRRLLFAFAGAIATFGLASHHYLGWIAILTGIPLFLLAIFFRWRGLGWTGWLGLLIMAVGAILFPILWILGSWHYLGSPLAFLKNQMELNRMHMQDHSHIEVSAFFANPSTYWKQAAFLVFPALASMALRVGPNWFLRRLSLGLFIFTFLLLHSLRAHLSGFYVTHERYVALHYMLTFPLAGAAIGDLVSALFGPKRLSLPLRTALMGLLSCFMFCWCAYNVSISFKYSKTNGTAEWPTDTLTVGYWLKRELNYPQILTVEEIRGTLGVFELDPAGFSLNFMAYTSGRPDSLLPVAHVSWPSQIPMGFRVVISNDEVIPEGFVQITSFGQWRVLRRS